MTEIGEKSADSTLKRKKKNANKKEKAKKLKLNSNAEQSENLHKLQQDDTDSKPDTNSDSVSQINQKKAKKDKKKKNLEKPDSNSDSKLNQDEKEKTPKKKKKKLNNENQEVQKPDSDSDSETNNEEKSPKKKKTLQSYDTLMTPDERQRTIFVNNLPLSVTKKDIAKIFTTCGQVESVRIRSAIPKEGNALKKIAVIKQEYAEENKNNLNAYVKFMKKSDIEKALKINGVLFGGHRLQVDKCQENMKYDNKRSIFLGNLTFNAKEDDIFTHFADCGEIERVRLIRDKISGVGKGIGFVVFKDPGSVELALKLNGENFGDRPLRISHVIKKMKNSKKNQKNFKNKKFMNKKNMKNDNKNESRDQKNESPGQKNESSDQKNESRDKKMKKKNKKIMQSGKIGKMPKTFMT